MVIDPTSDPFNPDVTIHNTYKVSNFLGKTPFEGPEIVSDFSCYLVRKTGKDQIEAGFERRPIHELPDGEVLIGVEYSSLNYKDALAATGHPGVARKFPHVPGIDAAGTVVESRSSNFARGDRVLVTGYDLGAGRWGGWAEYVRVPAEWVIPLPNGMTLEQSMRYGTAGFTAALSVMTLQQHGVMPGSGEVLVTGSTGGVGCIAVQLLSTLGYSVTAVTGKQDRHDWLRQIGAQKIIGREEVDVAGGNPLLSARWTGAVDTVGGNTLATVLRTTNIGGCVTACGLVGGADLHLTVYPFILRGVTLAGIDTAWTAREKRLAIWNKHAGDWKLPQLEEISTTVSLSEIDGQVRRILSGQIAGRVVVRIRNSS